MNCRMAPIYYFCSHRKMKKMKKYLAVLGLFTFMACNNNNNSDNPNPSEKEDTPNGIAAPQTISYNIISVYPHDTGSYTQGLEIYKGKFYEGSGDYDNSSVRIADIKTGKVEKKHLMGSKDIFGEGITILNGKLYQLTWQSNIVYVYYVNNIDKPIKTFKWSSEGWGLTHNATDLIISDGITSNIYFVDPETFRVKTTLQVSDNAGPVDSINELEYIDGYIYANVYLTDYIIKIDPANGHVVGKLSLPGIIRQYAPDYNPKQGEVLNGIAWDSASKRMYITGKKWPKLFEISIN